MSMQDRPLNDTGGKGLFTKEIEEALLDGAIDLAVHSSKDMTTVLPPGLALSAFLPREDPRDAFISRKAKTLRELPPSAVVGTASLRRQAMVKRVRPDLAMVPLRGNVETRLRKIEAGDADATLLAVAGLKRLGLLASRDRVARHRRISPRRRPGRHRHRDPRRRCGDARARRQDQRSPTPRPRSPPSAPSLPCSTARAARRSAAMRASLMMSSASAA